MDVQVQAEPFHSLEWMHQLRDAEIRPELRLLGYAMMAYANAQGEMFPTLDQLALLTPAGEDGHASTKTVQRRRNELVRLGWIERVSKGNGRGRASVYRLTFPAGNPDNQAAETRTETRTPTPPETRTGVSDQERKQELPLGSSIAANGNGLIPTPSLEAQESVSADYELGRAQAIHACCHFCGEAEPTVSDRAGQGTAANVTSELLACDDCAKVRLGVGEFDEHPPVEVTPWQ